MKTCSNCKISKPLTEYNKCQSRCKPCQVQYAYEWKANNLDKHKISSKKYYTSDKGKATALRATKAWEDKMQGVYGIFSDDTCLYVGESKRLNGRMNDHRYWIRHPHKSMNQVDFYTTLQKHRNITIKILEVCNDHKNKEQHYIDTYKPLYNTKNN